MAGGEIWVLPAFGQGHLFPCIKLCKLIASRNYKATLVVFSTLSSSIPSSFHDDPLTDVIVVPAAPPRPGNGGVPPPDGTGQGPFLEYLANQVGKPVWAVGPLLPNQYWTSSGSLLQDREIRPNKQSNVTEEDIIRWLGSKPRGSVIYVSFGSSVGLTTEEYDTLAKALAESTWLFIWVIQPGSGGSEEGYYPHGLEARARERALIITGWAPQLLILSHPSTGGFLSHCGWNSSVEALGRGVPFLAWPIRGDQFYNAKLVVDHLKVGHMVSDDDLVVSNNLSMCREYKVATRGRTICGPTVVQI